MLMHLIWTQQIHCSYCTVAQLAEARRMQCLKWGKGTSCELPSGSLGRSGAVRETSAAAVKIWMKKKKKDPDKVLNAQESCQSSANKQQEDLHGDTWQLTLVLSDAF